jgi:hypothetical protein
MLHIIVLRLVRLGLAALTLTAIAVQFSSSSDSGFPAADFFSFFTIQCNLLACGVFIWTALRPDPDSRAQAIARGAVTLYMSIVGIVFALLLSGIQEELQTTKPWVNTVVHQLMPLAVFLDWVLKPPRVRIPVRAAATWLIFPLAYLGYTLIRGAITGWYPYPFLDPGTEGSGAVVAHSAGIFICALVVGWAVLEIARARISSS